MSDVEYNRRIITDSATADTPELLSICLYKIKEFAEIHTFKYIQ